MINPEGLVAAAKGEKWEEFSLRQIRDRAGGLLGTHNPHTAKTQDRSGRVIGNSGDVRASLIPKDEQ